MDRTGTAGVHPGDRTADIVAIQQVLARYPHAVDDRDWESFDQVFTHDAVCDMTAVGLGTTNDRDVLVDLFARIDHPVAHHLVDPVIAFDGPDHAAVVSKWWVVLADRTGMSGTYTDDVVRTAAGWRIRRRRVTPRQDGTRRPVPLYRDVTSPDQGGSTDSWRRS